MPPKRKRSRLTAPRKKQKTEKAKDQEPEKEKQEDKEGPTISITGQVEGKEVNKTFTLEEAADELAALTAYKACALILGRELERAATRIRREVHGEDELSQAIRDLLSVLGDNPLQDE